MSKTAVMDAYKQSTKPHPQPAEQQDLDPQRRVREDSPADDPVDGPVVDPVEESFPATRDLPRDHKGHEGQ